MVPLCAPPQQSVAPVQTTSQGKQLNIYVGATLASASAEFSETGDYSNPGEITGEWDIGTWKGVMECGRRYRISLSCMSLEVCCGHVIKFSHALVVFPAFHRYTPN